MIATAAMVWVLVMYRDGGATVDMQSREACVAAARYIDSRTRIYALCVNRATGETAR